MRAIQTAHPETNGTSVVDLLGPKDAYPCIPGTDIPLSPEFGIGSLASVAAALACLAVLFAFARVAAMLLQYGARGYAWASPREADMLEALFLKTGFPLVPAVVYGGLPFARRSRFAMRLDRCRVEDAEFGSEQWAAAWLLS